MALCSRGRLLAQSVVDRFLGLSRQHRLGCGIFSGALRLVIVAKQIGRSRNRARPELVDKTSDRSRDSGLCFFHS